MSPRTAAVPLEGRSIIAQRMVAARAQRGWRQVDLADVAGVAHKQIAQWETDIITPSVPNLIAIADALEVTLDWLVGRDGAPNNEPDAELALTPDGGEGAPDTAASIPAKASRSASGSFAQAAAGRGYDIGTAAGVAAARADYRVWDDVA